MSAFSDTRRQAQKRRTGTYLPSDEARHNPSTRIGFYSCWRLDSLGRWPIVRVQEREPAKRPRKIATVECPCGTTHDIALVWRALNEDEEANPHVWL